MYRLLTLFTLGIVLAASVGNHMADAKAQPVLKLGSKSWATQELQYRLHTLGYFNVKMTKSFGKVTRKAVQRFQRDHGLAGDGIAGPRTWSKLKKLSVNQKELAMLARVIHAEARGEGFKGQVAVGAVIMNRLQSPKFPKTIKGVIMQPKAFSAVNDGQYKLRPTRSAWEAAKAAVKGWDPTGNALFYYNPGVSKSGWFKTRKTTKRIGNHLFKS
jgi:N-acetylmuramoyl-L-alanine amidase